MRAAAIVALLAIAPACSAQPLSPQNMTVSELTGVIAGKPEGRALIPAMERAFPAELPQLMLSYQQRLRTAAAAQTQIGDFPNQEFRAFIASRHDALAHAPDADLLNVVKAMADSGKALTAECAAVDTAPNEPAFEASRVMDGQLMAAVILAEAAGVNHPVERQISSAHVASLVAAFTTQLPESLRYPSPGQQALSVGQRCQLSAEIFRWIGALPPADAVQVVALQHPGA